MTSFLITALSLHRDAPATAAFQPVGAPQCSAVFKQFPHTPVAFVSPQDALILRAQNRIGGVAPVCHLSADGSRPHHRLFEEQFGTRPEYTDS